MVVLILYTNEVYLFVAEYPLMFGRISHFAVHSLIQSITYIVRLAHVSDTPTPEPTRTQLNTHRDILSHRPSPERIQYGTRTRGAIWAG